LASAIVAVLGLLYAPFSGIVYFLALPGVLFSTVWAWSHRSPVRTLLTLSSALLLLGFLGGVATLIAYRAEPVPDQGYHEWVAASAFAILFALPGLSLLSAIPFEIIGLRLPGAVRLPRRGALR